MGNENKRFQIKVQPWTNDDGGLLADDILRERSKNWSQEVWDAFLDSTDPIQKEKQVEADHFDRLCDSSSESIFAHSQELASVELYAQLQNALFKLTERERSVVELLFYKSKSQREAARFLSMSQTRVRNLKQQSLKKLRTELHGGVLTLPLVNKQKKESSNVKENNQDDLDADSFAGA